MMYLETVNYFYGIGNSSLSRCSLINFYYCIISTIYSIDILIKFEIIIILENWSDTVKCHELNRIDGSETLFLSWK